LTIFFRILIFLFLLIALAEPYVSKTKIKKDNVKPKLVFAIDNSLSINNSEYQRAIGFCKEVIEKYGKNFEYAVLQFASFPNVTKRISQKLDSKEQIFKRKKQDKTSFQTDITFALSKAANILINGGHIVLCSDGQENSGNVLEILPALVRNNIRVHVYEIGNNFSDEVTILSFQAPYQVWYDEYFFIRAVINSNINTSAQLIFKKQGKVIKTEKVELKKGKNFFKFKQKAKNIAPVKYELEIKPEKDTIKLNNKYTTYVKVLKKPKILYIGDVKGYSRHFVNALKVEKIDCDFKEPSSISEDISKYSSVIINDVQYSRLPQKFVKALIKQVKNTGMGFVMIGGVNSYALGGYSKTPIERILPVDSTTSDKVIKPTVALVLIIDRSGSMNGPKMQNAKLAAIRIVSELKNQYIGIISFAGIYSWDVNIMRAGPNKSYIIKRINTIIPGGATVISPALQSAFMALNGVNAKIKHIILLSDGRPSFSERTTILDLITYYRNKIKISTVAVGRGADRQLLMDMAYYGGGKYYYTNNAAEIVNIFQSELKRIKGKPAVEKDFKPICVLDSPILRGINVKHWPKIKGFNGARPKKMAQVILTTDTGEPLLATWRYGLGNVVAYLSDVKPKWGTNFLLHKDFGKFWAQLINYTVKGTIFRFGYNFSISASTNSKGILLALDVIDSNGRYVNTLDFEVKLFPTASSDSKTYTARFVKDGHYVVEIPYKLPGLHKVKVYLLKRGKHLIDTLYITHNSGAELRNLYIDKEKLSAISGVTFGRFLTAPSDMEEILKTKIERVIDRKELWIYFVILALALFLIDMIIRKVSWYLFEKINQIKAEKSIQQGQETQRYLKLAEKYYKEAQMYEKQNIKDLAGSLYLKAKSFYEKGKSKKHARRMWQKYKKIIGT